MESPIKRDDYVKQPNELPNNVNSFNTIVQSIGFMGIGGIVFDQLRQCYPIGPIDESCSNNEVQLSNLYKCDVFHLGCYYTTSDQSLFADHLAEKHFNQSLFCFYCTYATDHKDDDDGHDECKQFVQFGQLIEHIQTIHGNQRYQCNLCFYRSVTPEQTMIHQSVEHIDNYEQTLKRTILDKKSNGESLNPIERQLSQIDDEVDTEVEDEDEDDEGVVSSALKGSKQSGKQLDQCKIIVCNENLEPIDIDMLNVDSFQKHGIKLKSNWNTTPNQLHCVYCSYEKSSNHSEQFDEFWVHCMADHPSYPILAYHSFKLDDLPLELNESTNLSLEKLYQLDNEAADTIVSDFRYRLATCIHRRGYNNTIMERAMNFYSSNESDHSNKRKYSDLDDDDNDNENDSQTVETGSKRRRLLFGRSIPESIIKKSKQIGTVLVTGMMAFGFYHFTHLLPESVQNYLN
ncbi:hypothetical protein RDWZM_004421 [Blomia tropicalis]|uniref:Uncharacterized protein n=1 Tax=Blomia tropicalis TaxID=40697 RepID=A0A9Q0RTH7_BLOTA|nr:hypothetical protein RDWZM_004421 [Blomia tropicalis]